MARLKRINARIESDLERLVTELARSQGVSLSTIIISALREFCERQVSAKPANTFESWSRAGLIGCFQGGRNLSRDYKKTFEKALDEKWPAK